MEKPHAGQALDSVAPPSLRRLSAPSIRRSLDILDEAELAMFLGIDQRTIQRWRAEGKGPAFIKAGNAVLFRLQDIREWLDQRVEQTAEVEFGNTGSRTARGRAR